jgi:hypothetical protein
VYGTKAASIDDNPQTNKGMFYGAQKFAAIRNDSLIVLDDGASMGGRKLISVGFPLGTGIWNTFGSHGSGTGQFMFYSGC